MPDGNGHGKYGPNKYARASRYAKSGDSDSEVQGALPARIVLPATQEDWRARRTPGIPLFQPILGDSSRRRRQAKQFIDDVALASSVADAITGFSKGAERLEEAHQDLELAHERRKLVPARAQRERMALHRELVEAQKSLEETIEEAVAQRVVRQRQRQIDTDDFEIEVIEREAAKLDAEAKKAEAAARLAYAERVGRQAGEADFYRAQGDSLRNQADAEAERRRLAEEREKRTQVAVPEPENGEPPEFAAFDASAKRARKNRKWGEALAEEIRARAAAEGRDVTDEEAEEIQEALDSAAAAEGAVRKSTALDFEV